MNESPQAKAVRESLPEDLRKVVNKVSFSYQAYLQIINEHLVTLYGDTADWSKCLDAYFNSPIYRDACHKVKKCGEIPIIKRDHIEQNPCKQRNCRISLNNDKFLPAVEICRIKPIV